MKKHVTGCLMRFIFQDMWLKNKNKEDRWLVSEEADIGIFPGWVVWIAWFLVWGAIIVSAFMVILYSLEWGGDKAAGWLGSFVLSLFEILLLTDPLLVSYYCMGLLLNIKCCCSLSS